MTTHRFFRACRWGAGIVAVASACSRGDSPQEAASHVRAAITSTAVGIQAKDIQAKYGTERVSHNPDDLAIWVHPQDAGRSLIIGTVKVPAPDGAVVVFGMDGRVLQTFAGIDRPNNVDVEYGLPFGGQPADIVVATERLKRRLRMFRIDREEARLVDLGGTAVLAGAQGEDGAPMGIALYKRPRDGAIFAIVAPKAGPRDGYLWQYRLSAGVDRVEATFVRRFGTFTGSTPIRENEIEAVAVDDALGYVYYADEGDGIHKWHADPDHPEANRELAVFGRTGYRGDREGIAIYTRADGTGYIVCTDQLDGRSEYHVYAREGAPGRPHDHVHELAVLRGPADATDGLEISSSNLGATLPHGAMIAMNSTPQNFLVFPWDDVAVALQSSAPRR